MFAISPEIRIGAGRRALNLPDLPVVVRARHLACLFHNLVTAGCLDDARAVLERLASRSNPLATPDRRSRGGSPRARSSTPTIVSDRRWS
jgi:hypothetical protein